MAKPPNKSKRRRRRRRPKGPRPTWPEVSDLRSPPKSEREARDRLGPRGRRARAHWQKFLPRAYANLVQHERLYLALHLAEALTVEAEMRLQGKGLPPHLAEEAVAQEWLFPVAENEGPSWLSPAPELSVESQIDPRFEAARAKAASVFGVPESLTPK